MNQIIIEIRSRRDSRRPLVIDRPSGRETPVFSRSSLRTISRLIDEARRIDPSYRAPNFADFSMIECRESPEVVRRELVTTSEVEVLGQYAISLPYRIDGEECQGINQEYLGRSPIGVEAEYSWDLPGGAGEGVRVADVERGWILDHPDLEGLRICPAPGGRSVDHPHGVAVLGILAASNNGVGVTGVAHSIDCAVISSSHRDEFECESIADAMVSAAGELHIGDILLVEFFSGGDGQWPIERLPSVFEVVRLLTAAGISVIEPAGNGFDEVQPSRDSGAIMVGAVDPILSPRDSYSVSEFSNFGARVDCYAWGRCIRTTTRARYSYFSGTSGAAAIIAGVAAALQGVSKTQKGHIILPRGMRAILRETGERVRKESRYEEGRVPNLKEMIEGRLSQVPNFL